MSELTKAHDDACFEIRPNMEVSSGSPLHEKLQKTNQSRDEGPFFSLDKGLVRSLRGARVRFQHHTCADKELCHCRR